MYYKKLSGILLVFVLLLAACQSTAPTHETMMVKEPTAVSMDEKSSDSMVKAEPTSETMMEETPMAENSAQDTMATEQSEPMSNEDMQEAAMDAPSWFNVSLTQASTSESFMITDFKGKVVLVETLAQWCSNCRKQQQQVIELHKLLGVRDDFVSLGLDIDPNEDIASLKAYTEKNGFTWTYTVAPAEVSNEIGNLYGDQFLNPPSTPMLIIDRHGEVHLLPFGIKSAQDLLAALQPYLDAGM
jgi:thiol-disulfide isomerase/thioredoxin